MTLLEKEEIKLLNKLTKNSPYFKNLIKQKYHSLKGYPEYKNIMFQLARVHTLYELQASNNLDFFYQDFTHKSSLVILNQANRLGFNSLWLNKNLLTAFNQTNLPEELPIFPRNITCGLLVFPPMITTPDGQYLRWLLFYHHKNEEKIPAIKIDNHLLEIEANQEDYISWFTVLDDSVQYSSTHKLYSDNKQLIIKEHHEFYLDDVLKELGKNIDTQTEKEFMVKVTQILIQTLLYTHLKDISLSAKIDKSKILEPLIIGKNYQVVNQSEEGSKKRTHWRRGFFRWQPYGSRENPEYKLIWIEPMLING